MVEKRHNALGELVTVSEATVKVFVDGGEEPLWSVAEGNGPVNALDQALRKDLGRYQSIIKDVELVDYKVRILTGGTEAVTRVLVESRDKAHGRALVHGRRVAQHRRCQLRGADRLASPTSCCGPARAAEA